MPDLDRAVFGTRDENRERGVEDGERDVGGVAFQGLNARLGEVVPDLDEAAGKRSQLGVREVCWEGEGRSGAARRMGEGQRTHRSSPVVTRYGLSPPW